MGCVKSPYCSSLLIWITSSEFMTGNIDKGARLQKKKNHGVSMVDMLLNADDIVMMDGNDEGIWKGKREESKNE